MKANAGSLRRLDPAVRLVLLHGSDASASADLARTIARRLGAEVTVISAATLNGDPGALTAAASAIPMFGGVQMVRVDDAGDDVLAAVELLLGARAAGTLVVVVAGALKKGSKLVARVEAAADCVAVVNHVPDAATTAASIAEIAAEAGLRPSRDAVAAIAQATGGDRGIVRQEIAKLALFVDATPGRAVEVDTAAIAAIGADFGDADLDRLVNGVAGGDPVVVAQQLAELDAGSVSGVALLRAVGRRFWLLLDLRAAVDGGASAARVVETARPPVFWKERPAVAAQIARWRTAALRGALDRLLDAERAVKRSGSAGTVAVDQLLLSLAVQARG